MLHNDMLITLLPDTHLHETWQVHDVPTQCLGPPLIKEYSPRGLQLTPSPVTLARPSIPFMYMYLYGRVLFGPFRRKGVLFGD